MVELIWTVFSVVGLIYSLAGLRLAFGDWRTVRRRAIYNGRRRIARDALVLQLILTAKLGAWGGLGLAIMLAPGDARVSPASIILIGGNAGSAVMAALIYYGAKYLLRTSTTVTVAEDRPA